MNIQFSQFKKLSALLSSVNPLYDGDKDELNKSSAEKYIRQLVFLIDALIKAENLHKKRNLILPEGRSFFTGNIMELMANINLYLYKFDTKVLNLSRTERQTFIFILENVIDYFKNAALYTDKSDRKNLFLDYRFWVENFFKMVDQKLSGAILNSKKVLLKTLFSSDDAAKNQLVFTNSSVSFPTAPFLVAKGTQYLILAGISGDALAYRDLDFNGEVFIKNRFCDAQVFEFLISNFDFERAASLKDRELGDLSPLADYYDVLSKACDFHRERRFKDSFDLVREIPLEKIDLPLVYLLQIKNLVNNNQIFEVKQVMQKFLQIYPYYVDAYEIMGDIYAKEENLELSVNFYEKVLMLTQNKRVAEKLKKIRETLVRTKNKAAPQASEYFYDINDSVFSSDEELILREREQRQMVEVLMSRSRRNIMLVGESGVGKTALIKLLAQKIISGNVPEYLKEMRLREINFVALLTGSKYRGQFEEKALKLLSDFKGQKAILVLEDIHLMMSLGQARGASMDLINILKQFLRESSIQVIATTNYDEFKNTVDKDNALTAFFQKLTLPEMTVEDTRMVLNNLSKNLLSREKIIVPGDIVDRIVESAKRDVRDKRLPDSAIMLFERVVAKLKVKHVGDESLPIKVEQNDLVEVLSDILNLPESNISISMKTRLTRLREELLSRIIGQDDCIERIAANIITSKLEFDVKKNRPDGVFLFIGPTGVGKTETAIALAKSLYGSEDYLIRIDMSEYMEKFTYSRFIGAAPGYVGYLDSNQLTDKVRQNPFSVILLDEIEKADSQLLNIFLQVFDAGRLTDSRGNVVDFSHATIIMTSNIGTSLFSRTMVGYQNDPDFNDVSDASLFKTLKKHFSPEFLNRVDEVVIFRHLEREDIRKIIHLNLKSTYEQFAVMDKELVIRDEVIDFIVDKGYSREYGARHIARTLRRQILEKIARYALEKEWDETRMVICSLINHEVQVICFPGEMQELEKSGMIHIEHEN